MKCSLFHEQNDLKIWKKKINTDISNDPPPPCLPTIIAMATRHRKPEPSRVAPKYFRVAWSKIAQKEAFHSQMWIYGYISWNWQEMKRMKAARRVFPRISRPDFQLRGTSITTRSKVNKSLTLNFHSHNPVLGPNHSPHHWTFPSDLHHPLI